MLKHVDRQQYIRYLNKQVTLDQLFSQICYRLTLERNLPKQIDCENKKDVQEIQVKYEDAKDNPILYA